MERPAHSIKLALNERAPYFSLRATDGKIYSISDFTNSRALVVIFTCNHCPYAQAYESRICDLAKEFKPRGVEFVAVCANDPRAYPEDDFSRMVEKSEKLGQPFPYLHDDTQIMAQAYDAACTPEAFLFDSELKLQYHGRIDDNYQNPSLVSQSELRDAIVAVLSGVTPEVQLTPCIGCSIKWKL